MCQLVVELQWVVPAGARSWRLVAEGGVGRRLLYEDGKHAADSCHAATDDWAIVRIGMRARRRRSIRVCSFSWIVERVLLGRELRSKSPASPSASNRYCHLRAVPSLRSAQLAAPCKNRSGILMTVHPVVFLGLLKLGELHFPRTFG